MYAQWAHAMAPWVLPLGLTALLLGPSGIALMAWAGRRRFNRRNFAGIEEFSGYGDALGSRMIEGFISLMGRLFFAVGLLAGFVAAYGLYLQTYA